MKLRLQFLSIFVCVFFTSFSQIQTINTNGMTFTPDTVTITLGDTIEFGPLGYHNAVEIDESSWISNDTTYNGGFYFSLEVQEVTLYLILRKLIIIYVNLMHLCQ